MKINKIVDKSHFVWVQTIAMIALCVTLAGGLLSCDRTKPFVVDYGDFKGTQWKLVHIIPQNIHELEYPLILENTILEPHDCDTCFTITFDAERKGYATGISILNTMEFRILMDSEYPEGGFPWCKVTVTELDEPFDGNLYSELMSSVTRHYADNVSEGPFLVLSVGDISHIFYNLVFECKDPNFKLINRHKR